MAIYSGKDSNMISIRPATLSDVQLLSFIAPQVHMESHGHSAKPEHHEVYISKKLSIQAFTDELANPENLYHIIYVDDVAAGYSKIILNFNHEFVAEHL